MKELGRDLRLEINEYADISFSEFNKIKNGLKIDNSFEKEEIYNNQDIQNIPDSIDWRNIGIVSAVENEEQCGSCWAFAAVGVIESRYALKIGKLINLSVQELIDCENLDNGCEGGLMINAFKWLETHKLETEAD